MTHELTKQAYNLWFNMKEVAVLLILTYKSVKLFMPNEYDTLISLSGLK